MQGKAKTFPIFCSEMNSSCTTVRELTSTITKDNCALTQLCHQHLKLSVHVLPLILILFSCLSFSFNRTPYTINFTDYLKHSHWCLFKHWNSFSLLGTGTMGVTPLMLKSSVYLHELRFKICLKMWFTFHKINNTLPSIQCHIHQFSFLAQVFSSSPY